MKQLAVLSGKGGTGKTTVAAAFVKLAANHAFADCDVDAPNLQLLFDCRKDLLRGKYYGLKKAVKDDAACVGCGKCEAHCRFDAISNGVLNRLLCEGCGVCEYVCPALDVNGNKAIRLQPNHAGDMFVCETEPALFSGAQLIMGNGATGKLVTEVRKNLSAKISGQQLIILDGPPGIGCPVIATLVGVHFVVIVTEPTSAGIHDMKRLIASIRNFGINCGVCINKYNINLDNTDVIERYCVKAEVPILGWIPVDNVCVTAINHGKSIVDYPDSQAATNVAAVWERVKKIGGIV